VLGTNQADGEPYAELAHETLIAAWQRLRDLVAGNAEFLGWLA
jgi:DNA-directed RNA polymerase specialized sigma24 family protein